VPLRSRSRRAVPLGALAIALLAVPSASAQSLAPQFAPPGAAAPSQTVEKSPAGVPAELDPRLAELSDPAIRAAPPAVKAERLGLPESGPGSLVQDGANVVVRVRMRSVTDQRVSDLRAAGGRILAMNSALAMATVSVAPTALEGLAKVAGVESVTPEYAPMTSQFDTSAECHGSVTSEADTQLRAAEARQTFGVTGAGVTVGLISDSFNTSGNGSTATDVGTGDLPGAANPCGRLTPVNVLGDAAGADEGRAMAQVVHDLAPDAALAFEPSGNSELQMAQNIVNLANAGADVIADDITFLDEPFFQESLISDTANQVVAAGIPYFSSAANNNFLPDTRDGSSYEAALYRSTTCPASVAAAPQQPANPSCMDYDPGPGTANLQPFVVAPGRQIRFDFQWAQPWFGVTTDYDLFLLNSSFNIITSARSDDLASQVPWEDLFHTNNTGANETVYLVINKFDAAAPDTRLKWVLLRPRGAVLSATSVLAPDVFGPSIFGHNGGEGTMSVAAVPFDNSATVEEFSSRGPVTLYFGPVRGNTAAAPLPAPRTLAKPDIAATDGALTTFFGSAAAGGFRFFGTSEAAPHAAAVAALQRQFAPSASPAAIGNAQRSTASAVGSFGPAARGGGLLNAVGAVGALAAPQPQPPAPQPIPPPTGPNIPAPKTLNSVKVDRCKQSGRGSTLKLKCRLRNSDALRSSTATIKKGRRTVATGKAKLTKSTLSVKLKRKLRKGSYTLRLALRGTGTTKRTLNVKFKI
jgi:hypothetical protein